MDAEKSIFDGAGLGKPQQFVVNARAGMFDSEENTMETEKGKMRKKKSFIGPRQEGITQNLYSPFEFPQQILQIEGSKVKGSKEKGNP